MTFIVPAIWSPHSYSHKPRDKQSESVLPFQASQPRRPQPRGRGGRGGGLERRVHPAEAAEGQEDGGHGRLHRRGQPLQERLRQRHLLRDRGLEVVRALQELSVLAVGAERRDGTLRARDEVSGKENEVIETAPEVKTDTFDLKFKTSFGVNQQKTQHEPRYAIPILKCTLFNENNAGLPRNTNLFRPSNLQNRLRSHVYFSTKSAHGSMFKKACILQVRMYTILGPRTVIVL